MKNSSVAFYGQQEGENILYSITPHPIGMWTSSIKLFIGALSIWVGGVIISKQLPNIASSASIIGFMGALVVGVIGFLAILKMEENAIAYITNRRIIRFLSHNPFATVIRTLTWDQASKVKTYPPNLFLKMFKIGSVVIHSKSAAINTDAPLSEKRTNSDDVDLEYVYYYKDLGNYIDKIIYLYNREPENLASLKPFVPKPKGMRY